MQRHSKLAALAALTMLGTGMAIAQDGPSPEQRALNIRQAHMQNYAANLGVLGGMAQSNAEYDAAAAQVAADNLFHLVSIDQSHYWLPGTSNADIEESRALPAIWENMEDFQAKHQTLVEAVTALQSAAGTNLASLQGAMGGVGQACGACHETYREAQQ